MSKKYFIGVYTRTGKEAHSRMKILMDELYVNGINFYVYLHKLCIDTPHCTLAFIPYNLVDTTFKGWIFDATFYFTKEMQIYLNRDHKPTEYEGSYIDYIIEKEKGDLKMTGNEYQELASRTINKKLSTPDMENHALFGMCGEVGELMSLYQKVFQGHELDDEHAKKELGDLMWFISEYCTARGWNLDDIMKINIEKLKNRYPEGFEVNRSLNRVAGDI